MGVILLMILILTKRFHFAIKIILKTGGGEPITPFHNLCGEKWQFEIVLYLSGLKQH
jgi:hypothetical protein